jgi:ubiquitin-conjugating enzyme E2 variant
MPRDNDHESDLARGYAPSHRAYEWAGITVAILCGGWLFLRIYRGPLPLYVIPLATIVGMLFADFISGFVHWAFDTWGTTRTPVLGQIAIRTFREHHVDQRAITRHDFIETNGHNFALSVITSGSGLWVTSEDVGGSPALGSFFLAAAIFVSMTSQIHKWAHMDQPPRLVRALQRARIFISPQHHATHHTAPFTRYYCITTGWLNRPLRFFRFFESLEAIVIATTGATARPEEPPPPPEELEEAPQPE